MQGYQQTYMNLRIWDMRMQGYKEAHMNLRIWGCKNASIQANAYEPEDMRMWGCKDPSKYTRNWGHDDAEIQAEHMNLKIRGYKKKKNDFQHVSKVTSESPFGQIF